MWPRYNKDDMKYLLIKSSTPELSKNPFLDEYNFWSELPLMSNVNIRKHSKIELWITRKHWHFNVNYTNRHLRCVLDVNR